MVRRKNRAIIFTGILLITWLAVSVTPTVATSADEQEQALIGEWTGVWPGISGDTSTLIVHEIDAEKAKARCIYIVSRRDTGTKEYSVLAALVPGSETGLEFKLPYGQLRFVLKGKVLQGFFRGAHRGDGTYWENTIEMEQKPRY